MIRDQRGKGWEYPPDTLQNTRNRSVEDVSYYQVKGYIYRRNNYEY